jgi:uncharacterized membrane-anchored protein YhcB (DUF1043 family)
MDYIALIIGILIGAVVGYFIASSRKGSNDGLLAENNLLKSDLEEKKRRP